MNLPLAGRDAASVLLGLPWGAMLRQSLHLRYSCPSGRDADGLAILPAGWTLRYPLA